MKDERDVYFGKVLAGWIDFAVVGSSFEEQKTLFAKRMKVAMDTLDGWLSGDVHMSTEDYLKACEIFETPPEDIMDLLPDDLYDKVTYDGDEAKAMIYALQEIVDEEEIDQALHSVELAVKKITDAIEAARKNVEVRWAMLDDARETVRGNRSEEVEHGSTRL